jgi:GxxExxY protein
MKELIDEVRQIAYDVHKYLGNGYLEKVYENCLRHRLELAGHKVEAQKPLRVFDSDGFLLGEYFADLVVDDALIVELKAAKALSNEHLAQILNYLKTTGLEYGLLINFGAYRFEIRSVVLNERRNSL